MEMSCRQLERSLESERERWRFSHVGSIESRKRFKIIRKNQNVMGNIRPPWKRPTLKNRH